MTLITNKFEMDNLDCQKRNGESLNVSTQSGINVEPTQISPAVVRKSRFCFYVTLLATVVMVLTLGANLHIIEQKFALVAQRLNSLHMKGEIGAQMRDLPTSPEIIEKLEQLRNKLQSKEEELLQQTKINADLESRNKKLQISMVLFDDTLEVQRNIMMNMTTIFKTMSKVIKLQEHNMSRLADRLRNKEQQLKALNAMEDVRMEFYMMKNIRNKTDRQAPDTEGNETTSNNLTRCEQLELELKAKDKQAKERDVEMYKLTRNLIHNMQKLHNQHLDDHQIIQLQRNLILGFSTYVKVNKNLKSYATGLRGTIRNEKQLSRKYKTLYEKCNHDLQLSKARDLIKNLKQQDKAHWNCFMSHHDHDQQQLVPHDITNNNTSPFQNLSRDALIEHYVEHHPEFISLNASNMTVRVKKGRDYGALLLIQDQAFAARSNANDDGTVQFLTQVLENNEGPLDTSKEHCRYEVSVHKKGLQDLVVFEKCFVPREVSPNVLKEYYEIDEDGNEDLTYTVTIY